MGGFNYPDGLTQALFDLAHRDWDGDACVECGFSICRCDGTDDREICPECGVTVDLCRCESV